MSKKGSSSTTTYYGTVLYRIGHGVIDKVHCIKVDSITVWKDVTGVSISGEYIDISTDVGTCRVYKGSWTQEPDPNANFVDGPAYRGIAYMRWERLKLGSEKTAQPSIEIECTWGNAGLVSPVEYIQELYTDSRLGLGADESLFECSDDVREDTIKLAPKIADETTLEDLCDDLLPLVWCYARFEGPKLIIDRLYEPPDDWESVPSLSKDNCLELNGVGPKTPTENITTTIVRWRETYDGDDGDDTEGEYDNVAIYRDPDANQLGEKSTTVQADAIITESVASSFAMEKGHQLALSQCQGTAVVPRGLYTYDELAYNAPIRVYDDISGQWIRARVKSRSIPYAGRGIEIDWESDYSGSIHDSASVGYQSPTFTSLEPVDPRAVMVLELPRSIKAEPAIGILCARGSYVVNGFVTYLSLDDGANWRYVGNYGAFTTYGTLDSNISVSSGSVTVGDVTIDDDAIDSASSAEAAADTILGFIGTSTDHEIVSISTITAGEDQLTISMLRGRLGTTPQAWPADTPIHIIKRSDLPIVTSSVDEPSTIVDTSLNPDDGNEYLLHLPQRVGLNAQTADDCDDIAITVAGAYSRPIPPQNLQMTQEWTTSQPMILTWETIAWRDEGYPSADFYEVDELQIVPVAIISGERYALPTLAAGTLTTSIDWSTVSALATDPGEVTIELFTLVSDRHSMTGASVDAITPDTIYAFDGDPLHAFDGSTLKYFS